MQVIIDSTAKCVSQAAERFIALLRRKPNAVLGLATGSTPEALYGKLIEQYKAGIISFQKVTTFNLDEYVGLDGNHPQSYRHFMQEKLFDHVDIDLKRTHVPDGMNTTPDNAADYDKMIEAAGGIDLLLLGIGTNGHIGFNEPGSSFDALTHIVDLNESTRQANARFFASFEDVPKQAVTMGIHTIMQARSIILMAFGIGKSRAIAGAVTGPVSTDVPASILRLHPDVTMFVDDGAAADIKV